MQSTKETASNIAASAKSGMDKTKATMEEKAEKMSTRNPVEKQMATEKKDARVDEAEMEKRETRAHNAAVKEASRAAPIGTNTGTGRTTAHNTHLGGGGTTGYGTGGGYTG